MKKRYLLVFLVSLLVASLVLSGCGGSKKDDASIEPEENSGVAQEAEKQGTKNPSDYKVALVLSGPVNDGGWNATGFKGVDEAKAKYGFQLAYTENVGTSDQEEVIRGYANDGYDLIICHGFQFGDAVLKLAPQFENSYFLVTSSNQHIQEPNVGCAQPSY